MPTVDIRFKLNGLFHDAVTYKDIREHNITYTEYHVMINFKKINKKTGLEREYIFTIPKSNLSFITVRINE